jgi:deazaflavin-dependent oxidoreductase (nitroreductase family)
MTEPEDFNAQTIARFRANGGVMDETPYILVHHRGRRSGKAYVTPMIYLRDQDDPDLVYVFASKAGAPTHPDWYQNLIHAGSTEIEVGPETYEVSVTDLQGEERTRIYAEQVAAFPMFADYEQKTAGIRTIPVLGLHRRR